MRPPDDLRAARVTLAIAALTAAAWLIAWLGGWQEVAVVAGGFIPARVGGLAGDGLAGAGAADAADRDPGPFGLRPPRSST